MISVSTIAFDGYAPELAFDEMAKLGVETAELAYIQGYFSFDESVFAEANARLVSSQLREAGLTCAAISAHIDCGMPEARTYLQRRLEFARRLGATMVVTNATTHERKRKFMAAIDAIHPVLEELDMILALENPGHGTQNLLGTTGEACTLLADIGSPHIRLNADAGNVFTYSKEQAAPEQWLAEVLPLCSCVHLKDVRSGDGGWTFTAIGDGSLDYAAILDELRDWSVDNPVSIELPLRLRRPRREDPVRSQSPVPLPRIRKAISDSLSLVQSKLRD